LRARDWHAPASRLAFAMAMLIAALVVNAAICGVLSGPFPRYQARMIWLLTVAAACGLATLAPEWSRQTAMLSTLAAHPWIKAAAKRPEVAWALERFDPAFLRFALVGATGFVIDRLVLGSAIGLGLNAFTGRFVSFPVAVLCTWLLNRSFTFRRETGHHHPPLKQALIYTGVQLAGGALNVAAYDLTIWLVPALKAHLLIPLAIGSALGLCVTFAGSKRLAFPAPSQP
jgi:putative flippase GtrA